MRGWLLIAKVALVGVVAALVVASDGSAGVNVLTVALTATGPSPSTVRMHPVVGMLEFVNADSVAHTVVFAHGRCSLTVPPGGPEQVDHGCGHNFLAFVGSHSYTEDGSFPGEVDVVGFARSVSLTARTHTIRPGSLLNLHGQLTDGKEGAQAFDPAFGTLCGGHSGEIWILQRHDRTDPFKRILKHVPISGSKQARVGRHGCTYTWQLNVRPGERITYIAEYRGDERLWRDATSRSFTVVTRP